MRFIRDLSWETEKMLERIYRYSEHHQTRQRAKCLLLSFQRTTIKELMKIFEVTRTYPPYAIIKVAITSDKGLLIKR